MDIVRELKFTSEHMYASVLKWKAIQREILSNNSILENADRKNLYGQVRTIIKKRNFSSIKIFFSIIFKKYSEWSGSCPQCADGSKQRRQRVDQCSSIEGESEEKDCPSIPLGAGVWSEWTNWVGCPTSYPDACGDTRKAWI